MYCALDKIDLAATVEGRQIAVQTDHRSAAEIEREIELAVLFALARVINARQQFSRPATDIQVHYVVAEPPARLAEALEAAGAVVSASAARLPATEAPPYLEAMVEELADACFRELALRTAAIVGTRDLAMALRMLEDQTLADPPTLDDPARYWRRVLELAALTGELLRSRFAGARWVLTDRALVPFGFSLPMVANATTHTTTLFPTNRAQRVIEDGRDESLFKLLTAAEETMQRPLDEHGRLMPSLRDRDGVDLDELVWRTMLPEQSAGVLPIVVCGLDGENTFGMLRRDALSRSPDDVWAEALANLAAEEVELGELVSGDVSMIVVSDSFYAAEKLLDHAQLHALHTHLDAPLLLAATPARGGLLVTAYDDGVDTRFAAVVRKKYDAAGNRAISPVVWIVEDGRVTGMLHGTAPARADTGQVRAETVPSVQRRRK